MSRSPERVWIVFDGGYEGDALVYHAKPACPTEEYVHRREVERLERTLNLQQDHIDEWKCSTLLIDSGGDSSSITPNQNEEQIQKLVAENERLRALLIEGREAHRRTVILQQEKES